MKMSHKQALGILDAAESSTFADIKVAYRRACSIYHPDRNPAGLEMMKLVNAAYQALHDYVAAAGAARRDERNGIDDIDLGDVLNEALNAVINLEGIVIEICGSWIWLSGNTREHKEVIKEAGYRWAPKKCMWSFCGSEKRSSSRGKFSMDDIRSRHGSAYVKGESRVRLGS